jgi:hypothetical protein
MGLNAPIVSGVACPLLFAGCSDKKEDTGEEKDVSPPEDLMQEHGLLNRILLIYDTCRMQLTKFPKFTSRYIQGC